MTRIVLSMKDFSDLSTLLVDTRYRVVSVERQATAQMDDLAAISAASAGDASDDLARARSLLGDVTGGGSNGLPHLRGALWQVSDYVDRVHAQSVHADAASVTQLPAGQAALLRSLAKEGVNAKTLAKVRADLLAHDRHPGTGTGSTTIGPSSPHPRLPARQRRQIQTLSNDGVDSSTIAAVRKELLARDRHPVSGSGTTTIFASSGGHPGSGAGISRASEVDGIPVGLKRYGNGHLPRTSLEAVGPNAYLNKPAAKSFLRLESVARSQGIDIKVAHAYQPRSSGGAGAFGWGMAVDVTGAGSKWMTTHGAALGWQPLPGKPGSFFYKDPTG